MSSQNNNNYTTTLIFPNLYISRKLNNMDKVQVMKKEQKDWTRTYYKTLKGLEVIIDIQRMIKDIKKIIGKANMMITEMERSILLAIINNWTTNATNISGISEDLWYLVQSNIEDWAFQIQRMLVDKLDRYKERGNTYVNDNISEI